MLGVFPTTQITLAPSVSEAAEILNATCRFAVIGDSPYGAAQELDFQKVLRAIDDSQAQFSVHLGDLKSGNEVCSDNLLSQRIALLNSAKKPIFFTPGDNEWLDCHRHMAGMYDPIERLNFLRSKVFSRDLSLGKSSQATLSMRDKGFPENLRWHAALGSQSILFASFNLPGSKNGHDARQARRSIEERMSANFDWLVAAFKAASKISAPLIVISAHANPNFKWRAPKSQESPYGIWLEKLARHCRDFQGQVLYLHGDSHTYKNDFPLTDSLGSVRNLQRIECFGSPFTSHWIEILVTASGSSSKPTISALIRQS